LGGEKKEKQREVFERSPRLKKKKGGGDERGPYELAEGQQTISPFKVTRKK